MIVEMGDVLREMREMRGRRGSFYLIDDRRFYAEMWLWDIGIGYWILAIYSYYKSI
jgi:hypothetical protein